MDALIAEWCAAAAPRPPYRVSEWADANRLLPKNSAARGGQWRTAATPYLAGIMDAVLEPGVSKIAIKKCAQVGGSEALSNIIGFHAEYDPCAMLLIHPSKDVAEAWSKDRLDDMIQSTPALAAAIDLDKSTLTYKQFEGGYLALGGANTPNSFARWSVRLAMADDFDRFPAVVKDEGDPAALLANRVSTFFDGICIFNSTPTLKKGRIDTLYERSDKRRWFVRCPTCGREDFITWSDAAHVRVTWENRDPQTARLACPSEEHGGCGAIHTEWTRRQMVAGGRWVSTTTAKEPGLIGFHLHSMLSTLGSVTLEKLAAQWFAANDEGRESLKSFINTQLGEAWEERGSRMDPHVLTHRKEDYGGEDVEVPEWAAALTAGVDVQENRLEMLVTAWGLAGERAVVDYRRIPGELKQQETKDQLLEALSRRYRHALGIDLPILTTCIDSGYQTDAVYSFVLAHQARRIYATKGFAGRVGEPIVGKPSEKRTGKHGRPVPLFPINVDDAKADVMSSLAQVQAGPNYMHFPIYVDTIDDEFFAQLCAEHRQTVYKRGIATHQVWVQDRERNEALDASVLCLAAVRLLNPNIRQYLEQIQAAAGVKSDTPAKPAAAAAPRRRFYRSKSVD